MPRLVLLHGMGCRANQFDGLRRHLDGIDVVTPNADGRTLAELVDEIRAVVEPGDVVAGVSMGAATSLAYAVQPDAALGGLVQIAPGFDGDSPHPVGRRYLTWLADTLEAGGFDALRAAGEPLADQWERDFDTDYLIGLWRGIPVDLPVPDPADVAVPTLVIGWADDPLHPLAIAERLAARIPDARLATVPGPTSPELPAPDQIAALLRPLLSP